MELFYLADNRNPQMLEDLKDEYLRRKGYIPVTERYLRRFIDDCFDIAVKTFNANMVHIADNHSQANRKLYLNLEITHADIKKKTRVKPIVIARYCVMVALYKYSAMNQKNCGVIVNRDHATMIHAKKEIDSIVKFKDIAYYKPVKEFFDAISSKYRPHRHKRLLKKDYSKKLEL